MAADWIKTPNTRCFKGPLPGPILLVGREFNQEAYEKRIKTNEDWEKERCKIEANSSLLRKASRKEADEEFLRITNRRVYRSKLASIVNNELQLHRLSLELRRDRLRELLGSEEHEYRREAVANEPTIDNRLAEERRKLKDLRDRKEANRRAIVEAKYLQQAFQQHDELRSCYSKRLLVEADADRREQIREKRLDEIEKKHLDEVFYHQMLDEIAAKVRREEYEAAERGRANQEQVRVLREQIASSVANNRGMKDKQVAEEQAVLKEQLALREKEMLREREYEQQKRRSTRDMLMESIRLAKMKRDKEKFEENVFDLKVLEDDFADRNVDDQQRLLRKRELKDEIEKYLEALRESRRSEKEKAAEIDRAIQDDVDRSNAQKMKAWTAEAAARRRLLCDVALEQNRQREEKARSTELTKEDRIRRRQHLLAEMDELQRQAEMEKQMRYQSRRVYDLDLIGQIEYNRKRDDDERREEKRMIERQKLAEDEYREQIRYLKDNPLALKRHPLRLKYDEMMAKLSDGRTLSCGDK